jgi:hypothetical protein
MNKELWNKILSFDFDNPPSEYGFSIRLANENFWTIDFTQQAILEYKKFMYLAATSDLMVSPSEIIDTVWHQHLIFTHSYQEFCTILEKQIQHLPSTHNKEDLQKFKLAKERTIKFYENIFGSQPKSIWEYPDMYASLNLEKAKFKLRTFLIIGILGFLALTTPFYLLLRPVYVNLDNPYFILVLICLSALLFPVLELYNKVQLKRIAKTFDKNSFIYDLQPFELVYLKTQKLSKVIIGTLNEMVVNKTVKVKSNNLLELNINGPIQSSEQHQAVKALKELGKTTFHNLLSQLVLKPIFWNTANCMNAFKKYFNKSKAFGKLFYLNFGVLSLLIMIAFVRLVTGILRDKPVLQISIAVIALIALTIFYLNRLTKLVCTKTIPDLYRNDILPARKIEENWQWAYFLLGTAALTTSFKPVINYSNNNGDSGGAGGGCGSSGGSSCGSSCSSCGGCGGGD